MISSREMRAELEDGQLNSAASHFGQQASPRQGQAPLDQACPRHRECLPSGDTLCIAPVTS